ncbi:MAG: hypothetical protein F4X02_05430 [Chloroflexi bacterium]|nr:hypothetical protein [Chloroflexota bacterium]
MLATSCFLVLAACSPLLPAVAPPQLTHTPGAYIEIAKGHFQAESFQFDYPPSWRLVKQAATNSDGMRITLRAPGGGELSMRVVETDAGEDGRFILLAKGKSLLLSVDASRDPSAKLASEIERVIGSIRN